MQGPPSGTEGVGDLAERVLRPGPGPGLGAEGLAGAAGRLCAWLGGEGTAGAREPEAELAALQALAACVAAAREGAAPRSAAPAQALGVGAAAALRGARQLVAGDGCELCSLGWQVLGGALAVRAEGGARPPPPPPPHDAVSACVEALAALLPPGRGKKLREGSVYARTYTLALRTMALALEQGVDLSVPEVQAVVASCVKCFKYTGPAPGAAGGGGNAGGLPPASPARGRGGGEGGGGKGGYVPPHKRSASRGASDSEFSDSDVSDSEGRGGPGPGSERLPAAKARAAALHCLTTLARRGPKALQAHWAILFPSPSSLQPNPYAPNLGTVLLHDPAAPVRAAASACLSAMLEGAHQKAFLAVAEVPKKRAALRGFTTLSVTLGQCLMGLQVACLAAMEGERDPLVLSQVFKGAGVLAGQAPVGRLPAAFLPQLAGGAFARLQQLSPPAPPPGRGARPPADSSAGEPAGAVAALGCLAAVCGTRVPAAGLQGALQGEGPGPRACAQIPAAVVALACDEEAALGLRSEAFGVLQALARNYSATVEESWGLVHTCILRSLERREPYAGPSPSGGGGGGKVSGRGGHSATTEKLAQQGLKALTARLQGLAGDVCLSGAEEGAGGGSSGSGSVPRAGIEADSPRRRREGEEFARLLEHSAERHLKVASEHRSAMVRAAGFGVVSGSCNALIGGVSEAAVAALVSRAGDALVKDDAPAVRAAACKALGSLACVPPMAARHAELMQLGERLLGSSGDKSLSVRVPLAWSLANICDSFRASASVSRGDGAVRVRASDVHSLAEGSLVLCQDNDKVRANAVRALGYLLSCCDFEGGGDTRAAAWLSAGIERLLSSLSSGNVKVQWNCCYALGSLMENSSLLSQDAGRRFCPRILQSLLDLVKLSTNFKIRTHASAALTVPRAEAEYCGLLEEIAAGLYDTLVTLEAGGDASPGDAGRTGTGQDFKNRQALRMQLHSTLLHVVALLPSEEGAQAAGLGGGGQSERRAAARGLMGRAPGLARIIHAAHEQASAQAAAQVSEEAVAHLELSPKSTPSKFSLSLGPDSPRPQDKQGPVAVHAISSPGSAQKPLSFGVRDTRGAARALAGWVGEFSEEEEGSAAEAKSLLETCL